MCNTDPTVDLYVLMCSLETPYCPLSHSFPPTLCLLLLHFWSSKWTSFSFIQIFQVTYHNSYMDLNDMWWCLIRILCVCVTNTPLSQFMGVHYVRFKINL